MCLYLNNKYVKETGVSEFFENKESLKKKFKNGKAIFWKVLKVKSGKLCSPYFWRTWKYGINKSNRNRVKLSNFEKLSGQIDTGIHVYNTRQNARFRSFNMVVFKVECEYKDLVATNSFSKESVFMKVKLISKAR